MPVRFTETVWEEFENAERVQNAAANYRAKLTHDSLVERKLEQLRIAHEAKERHKAEIEAENTPGLDLRTLQDYNQNPPEAKKDLIRGAVKDKGLTVVIGPSGAGKSTIALQMLYSLASGKRWLGQKTKRLKGGFGILSYDMSEDLLVDWLNGFPKVDPARFSIVNAHGRGHPMAVPRFRSKIAEKWRDSGVEVVLVDSFSASFFGTNQNDTAETMSHYRDLQKFAFTEVGARSLIVIAHSTAANPMKARGSTAHKDVSDSIVVVTMDENGRQQVEVEKYRAKRGQEKMTPVITKVPHKKTHLVALDTGEMSLRGMALPPSKEAAKSQFPESPGPVFTETEHESERGEADL